MARLPVPGQDEGTWGTILNDYLSVEHNADGTLNVVHNTGAEAIAGTKTFSSSPVVPAPTLGSHVTNKTYVDTAITAGAPDATTTNKGLVQLSGDLTGTALSPVVAKVNGVAVSGTPTSGQVLIATNGTTASWATAPSLVFNVKDYGALGDGSTDDTAAINATTTAAAPTKGMVFFPPGIYMVSMSGTGVNRHAITVSAGVTLHGLSAEASIIKVVNSVGNYNAVIMGATTGAVLDGLTVEDLTVDQNNTNNTITAPSDLTSTGHARMAVLAGGIRITVRRCHFTDIDSINTISLGTGTGRDFVIENNLFDNIGTSPFIHDHSTLYVSSQRMRIVNNNFQAILSGKGSTTAIETHGTDQIITNNQINNFYKGINLTGVAPTSLGALFDSNVIRGCGWGVLLWSEAYSGNSTPYGIEDVIVSNNVIEIDYDAWTAVTSYKVGIGFDITANLAFHNVKIHNNTIRYKAFTATPTAGDNISCGIQYLRAGSTTYTGTDVNISITDNLIENPPASGMYLSPRGSGGMAKGLRVAGNTIINPGTGDSANFSSAFKVGMLLSGPFEDVRINDNTIIDNRATHVMSAGIDTGFVTTATNCEAVNNIVKLTEAAPSPVVREFQSANVALGVAAFYTRFRSNKYNQPTYAVQYGSQIVDVATGLTYTQTASPYGTAWTTGAVGLASATTTVAIAAAAAPTTGQVLTATSSTAATWQTPAGGSSAGAMTGLFTANRYYTAAAGSRTTSVISGGDGTMAAIPFWVGQTKTFDRIGANITTFAATTNVRLGIYSDNGSGSPGSLVIDAGTIDATTNGAKEVTMNQSLTPGLYWLVAVPQGGSPTFQAITGTLFPVGGGSLATVTGAGGTYGGLITAAGAVPGALPGTFPAIGNYIAFPPVIAVRAA